MKGLARAGQAFHLFCSVVGQGQAGAGLETSVMDRARRVGREDAGRFPGLAEPPQKFRQAFRLSGQRLDLLLERQDAPDPSRLIPSFWLRCWMWRSFATSFKE